MCWISKERIKRIAEEDISVFKIVCDDKKSLYKILGKHLGDDKEFEIAKYQLGI